MRRDLRTSAVAIVVFTVLFGLVYPLAMTGIAQVVLPGRANGSLIKLDGRVIGSTLIGQDFRGQARYFQERPSTATGYNAAASAFTNLGPNNRVARSTFRANLRAYLNLNRPYDRSLAAGQVPVDAVTSSGSGVDSEISMANADIQAHRVAAVRHLSLQAVDRLIARYTDGRFLGVFGEPGVSVLELNLALDRPAGARR
jgi:potassium-transporting ATPase KdpC subunit